MSSTIDAASGELDIDIVQLIGLVEQYPTIWNKNVDGYKNKRLTLEAWNELCASLLDEYEFMSAEDKATIRESIIQRWANLRDSYMKWNKKCADDKRSGGRKRKKYIYHDQMSFLMKIFNPSHPGLQSRQSAPSRPAHHQTTAASFLSSYVPNDDTVQLEIRTSEETTPKRAKSERGGKEHRDRHMSFFESLCPILEKFSDDDVLEFQMGVLGLARKIRNQQLAGTSASSHLENVIICEQILPLKDDT